MNTQTINLHNPMLQLRKSGITTTGLDAILKGLNQKNVFIFSDKKVEIINISDIKDTESLSTKICDKSITFWIDESNNSTYFLFNDASYKDFKKR